MQQPRDTVVCEFVRQRCTHDALFQPFYKRSNRTKGSKILRCFPHCCPNHAHRGFCGSSLHVRVEWPSDSGDHRSPPPPPSIHVLGRFRLSDTPPLPIGHALQASTVFGAVQSDDTPNGEWIDSQMIYSWSKTNWLFEINSAARWFYGWESSTVKSQRLKDHVLDVYVLVADGADVLRVVASTTSPSFQLISFRRATDDAMLALSATHHVRQQLQSGHQPQVGSNSHAMAQTPRPPVVRYHPEVPSSGPLLHAGPSLPPPPPVRPLHHLHPPLVVATHSSVPVTRPLSLPSLRPPLSSASPGSASQWTAPPLASTAAVTAPTRPLTTLALLHHAPPSLRAYPPSTRPLLHRPAAFAPPSHTQSDARPLGAWQPPQLAIASSRAASSSSSTLPPPAAVGGRNSAAWEVSNVLAQLRQIPLADAFKRVTWIHETYAQYAAEYAAEQQQTEPRVATDAEMSVRRALASLGVASTTRKMPSRLLTTVTELALWLLWDPVALRQLHGAARAATETLGDTALVRRRFSRTVFFLQDHMGRFVDRRFQTTTRDVLRECEALGFDVLREESGDAAMKGLDVFVAQSREVLVEATRSAKRRRLTGASTVRVAASLQAHLTQRWTCALHDVHVHRAAPSTRMADVSLFTLLWFYRQFSVLSLSLDADARLDARSLFALSSAPLSSKFVLDGNDRFVHAFPSGDATLATTAGRYSFGDYCGEIRADEHIRLRLFAFLAPSQLARDETTVESIAATACVCYDVTLAVQTHETLAVDVAVQTGALDVAALKRAGHRDARSLLREMATWSLRHKLAAVRAFDETCRVEMVYHA